MAKKTRREKIIAQYRRKLQMLEINSGNNVSSVIKEQPVEIKQVISKPINLSEEDSITKKYFISDFKKSLIIIVTVIALEIGLYFATMLVSKF